LLQERNICTRRRIAVMSSLNRYPGPAGKKGGGEGGGGRGMFLFQPSPLSTEAS
jgi:hypothetical protein